jgi:hypothetical protein
MSTETEGVGACCLLKPPRDDQNRIASARVIEARGERLSITGDVWQRAPRVTR